MNCRKKTEQDQYTHSHMQRQKHAHHTNSCTSRRHRRVSFLWYIYLLFASRSTQGHWTFRLEFSERFYFPLLESLAFVCAVTRRHIWNQNNIRESTPASPHDHNHNKALRSRFMESFHCNRCEMLWVFYRKTRNEHESKFIVTTEERNRFVTCGSAEANMNCVRAPLVCVFVRLHMTQILIDRIKSIAKIVTRPIINFTFVFFPCTRERP